jgi:hypothetical protein
MTDEIHVTTRPESPHTAALYDAGKQLLVESVEVGREFCKFMVGVSSGAIPTYLALVGLATGKSYRPTVAEGALLLLPALMFLAAATIFAFGYFPVQTQMSLDRPAEIEAAREANMRRRRTAARAGFAVFMLGVVLGLAAATYALSIDVPT